MMNPNKEQSKIKNDGQTGIAGEDQPRWAPPESQPEPRPTEPVLDEPQNAGAGRDSSSTTKSSN